MHPFYILPILLGATFAASEQVEPDQIPAEITITVLPSSPSLTGFDIEAALESVRAMAVNGGIVDLKKDLPFSKRQAKLALREDKSGCSACEPQKTIANYYKINADTASDFLEDPIIAAISTKASTPKGYDLVYNNLIFASNGYMYMGYETLDRPNGYNPDFCAARCNSLTGCSAFNIYFERDPVVDACSDTCQNPPAYVNMKCAYWGNPLVASSAKVEGQWRRQFHAVISGSNAYVNSTVLLDMAYKNEYINDKAIKAPIDCKGTDTFMGYVLFENTPFDVRLCAAACTAKTKYNRSQNSPRACNFWNTYILLKEGVAQGQFCALYTATWDDSYATNKGMYQDGQRYTISSSYVGTNTSFVPVCPSSPGF